MLRSRSLLQARKGRGSEWGNEGAGDGEMCSAVRQDL